MITETDIPMSPLKRRFFQGLSNLFHPLLSMVWATIVLVEFTPFMIKPSPLKWLLILEVAFFATILPATVILILSKLKIVKHGVALHDRSDRSLPLATEACCLLWLAVLLRQQYMPGWILQFYWGAFLMALVFLIVNFWYKVSAHTAGMAAICTASFLLYYRFIIFMPFLIPILSLVLTGWIGSIRLALNRHTLGQVALGALIGTMSMIIVNCCGN